LIFVAKRPTNAVLGSERGGSRQFGTECWRLLRRVDEELLLGFDWPVPDKSRDLAVLRVQPCDVSVLLEMFRTEMSTPVEFIASRARGFPEWRATSYPRAIYISEYVLD
jgi:hypothetical protein